MEGFVQPFPGLRPADPAVCRHVSLQRALPRAAMLRDRGAEVIMLASCIGKGTPIGFPCPYKGMMKQAIHAKLGEDFPVLEWSHEPSGKKC